MKKILFVASTLSHIENFHLPYLKYFKEHNYIVHIMGNPNNKSAIPYIDKTIPINFKKSMLSIDNFSKSLEIAKIIRRENYDIISIHTSLASFFTRLGIMLLSKKPKLVINTVHGYLFDDNSPLIKKTIMLLAEKFTKSVTDTIMVMNSSDYQIAKKHKLYKNNIYSINGMGINLSLFPSIPHENKVLLRQKHNLSSNDFLLIYAAEFSKRKNQKFLLNALNKLINDGYKDIKLLLLGDGMLLDECKIHAEKLGITENVFFIGYTKDTCTYYQMSDICVSSSRIEGLPFNIMEAMSIGLPIVASNVKGHADLVNQGENGFLFEYDNIYEFCNYVKNVYEDRELCYNMGTKSTELSKNYSIDRVSQEIVNIICSEYK